VEAAGISQSDTEAESRILRISGIHGLKSLVIRDHQFSKDSKLERAIMSEAKL